MGIIKDIKINSYLKDTLVFILLMGIAGYISILKGFDRCFDVRNYHIYNPYAFLNNRLTLDIMPADIQSYLNPLTDIPHYLLIKYLNNHPYFVTFLEGFSYAFLLFMIYKLSQLIFNRFHKEIMSILCTILGGSAALVLYSIGSLSNDLFIAGLTILSIYVLFKFNENKNPQRNILLSGTILGIACGLKLTNLLIGFSIFVSFCLYSKNYGKPLKSIISYGTGLFLGFMLSGGWWLIKIWILFGNPVFPYFNSIFHSNMLSTDNIFNADFAHLETPKNLIMYMFAPFYFYYHVPMLGFEGPFQDFRFAGLYIMFIFALITFKKKFDIIKEKYGINFKNIEFLLLSCAITYPIWINVFKQIRYLTFYASISAIIIFACIIKLFEIIPKLFPEKLTRYILFITIILTTLGIIFTTREPFMLRRIPIRDKVLRIEDMKIPDNSIVMAASSTAILIPFQNPKAKYIYLNAERLTKLGVHILSNPKIEEIRKITQENPNNLYILIDYSFNHSKDITKELQLVNSTQADKSSCKYIKTNLGNNRVPSMYHICKLKLN